jgi:hypothetical protein
VPAAREMASAAALTAAMIRRVMVDDLLIGGVRPGSTTTPPHRIRKLR